jgi:hypothetical protein
VEAAARVREDAVYLDALAARALSAATRAPRGGKGLLLDATALCAAERPIATRMARMALEVAGVDPRRISARHVEALLRIAASPGAALDLPGLKAQRTRAGAVRLLPTS